MEAFFKGMILGLALVITLGPIFFFLIQTSIEKGFLAGLSVACGTLVSDAMYISISLFSVTRLANNNSFKVILGFIGGGVLIAFGVYSFFKKTVIQDMHIELPKINYPTIAIKGFLINTLNPFVLIFWLGTSGYVTSQIHYESYHYFLFFAGTLSTVFSTDILKAYLSHRIKKFIDPRHVTIINRLAGIAMMIIGITLIWDVLHGTSVV
ncbi:MAG TPA: LysE family transporter [Gammaproteobacteria bacterium]|jgi:threonine/homoserine/homoserine lactone efflux protein|nr:LysE family transporter [Gammaproteobacteria bacterium]